MNQLSFMEYWDGSVAGAIILSGLVIVFLALIILIGVVQITGRITSSAADKPKAAPSSPAPAAKPAPVAVAPVPVAAPVAQGGIAGETVAAISAAVAAMMEEEAPGVEYSIANIQQSPNTNRRANRVGRPVWGFAGMQQNTRPF